MVKSNLAVDVDCSTSPAEAIEAANKLWLAATSQSDLEEVERLYRWALSHQASSRIADDDDGSSDDGPPTKKAKPGHCGINQEQVDRAGEKLGLLLCQSGRCKKAKMGLLSMGYTCRLAEQVLDYPYDDLITEKSHANTNKEQKNSSPCQIIDGFLSQSELEQLQLVFESPESSYWTDHNYSVDPPSPYFSYVLPLEELSPSNEKGESKFGFVGELALKIIACPILTKKFPQLQRSAKYVELWAHNRPHASGHQMHFDSDDEGRGGVRNPIISTVFYISSGDATTCERGPQQHAGGPTLVTNQQLTDVRLASRGWMAHAKPQRLVAFDGRCLHGVVPGKSFRTGRRVTLMMAFWENIQIRSGVGPGSARPFPTTNMPLWASQLASPAKKECRDYASCVETSPIQLDVIYETLDGKPWKRGMGMPSYDQVFQGF